MSRPGKASRLRGRACRWRSVAHGETVTVACEAVIAGGERADITVTVLDGRGGELQQFSLAIPLHSLEGERVYTGVESLASAENFTHARKKASDERSGELLFYHFLTDITPEHGGCRRYDGYVWNGSARRLERTKLRELCNPWLDEYAADARTQYRDRESDIYQIYTLADGEFVLERQLELLPDPPHDPATGELRYNYWEWGGRPVAFLETQMLDGEMQDVWPLLCNTEEGRKQIRKHMVARGDGVWLPSLLGTDEISWRDANIASQERAISPQEPARHTVATALCEGGEEYAIHFDYALRVAETHTVYDHGGERWEEGVPGDNDIHITVENAAGERIQQMQFASSIQWGGVNPDEWLVVDFNFDGYRDILCLESVGGAKANHFYVGWLWNPTAGQFEEIDLSELINLSVHARDESLRTVCAASAVHHILEIYHFLDGVLTMTHRLDEGRLGEGANRVNSLNGFSMETVERVDGELRDVFPDVITDTEEGRERLIEYLTGPHSVWFGENSPSFYASAYGDGITGRELERDHA